MQFEIRRYVNATGADVFGEWFAALADRQAQTRIRARLDRISRGLFGGGDKRKQQADINRAKDYWNDFKKRTRPKSTSSGERA